MARTFLVGADLLGGPPGGGSKPPPYGGGGGSPCRGRPPGRSVMREEQAPPLPWRGRGTLREQKRLPCVKGAPPKAVRDCHPCGGSVSQYRGNRSMPHAAAHLIRLGAYGAATPSPEGKATVREEQFSLRLGIAAAPQSSTSSLRGTPAARGLTAHRAVIQDPRAATLPLPYG